MAIVWYKILVQELWQILANWMVFVNILPSQIQLNSFDSIANELNKILLSIGNVHAAEESLIYQLCNRVAVICVKPTSIM